MRSRGRDTEWNYREKTFGNFECAKAKYNEANKLEIHSFIYKYLLNTYWGQILCRLWGYIPVLTKYTS